MIRPARHFASGLVLCAALLPACVAMAGEDAPPLPRPGLEIFDSAVPPTAPSQIPPPATAPVVPPAPDPMAGQFGQEPGQTPGQPETPESAAERRRRESERLDLFAEPVGAAPTVQPPYQAPELGRGSARPPVPPPAPGMAAPAAPAPGPGGVGPADGYGYDDDPFANLDEGAGPAPGPLPGRGYGPGSGQAAGPGQAGGGRYIEETYSEDPLAADPYLAPPPLLSVTDSLNRGNPNFPGLDAAAVEGNLDLAGAIIWETLKRRRVVDTTLVRGPLGSYGAIDPWDLEQLLLAIRATPVGPEDPLIAAARINTIIDSFQKTILNEASVGASMPAVLTRLHADIATVRYAMSIYDDEGVFLELARTYIRAATTCDFFIFPRKELVQDIRFIMDRANTMFYEDGSSRAGDSAGITGNLFQILLMIEHYSRDDTWFRRDVASVWRVLEKPARYLLDIARPDLSVPLFGPRGSRELGSLDLSALEAIYPRSGPLVNRIGLARTESFPAGSTEESYGGVYVTRDGRAANNRYLAVKFGPIGGLLAVPTHADFGSIEVMTGGIPFIVDAGGYGGNSATAAAHSGLALNGNYASVNTYTPPDTVSETVWRTNASIDYATDRAGFDDGKTWQRSVLYVKNLPGESRTDYWLLLDQVEMNGDPEPRQAHVRFQMAPGLQVYNDGSGIFASGPIVGNGLRIFAVDAGARMEVTDGAWADRAGQVFDVSGNALPAPAVNITRNLVGDSTTATILYPSDDYNHRPRRIDRDADIIRGRTGAIVVDHGLDRLDVIAWAPPGTELVTATLNLQMSADLAVFRIRRGRIARVDFVNLERFQAKEPDGGLWSMRVNGPAQTLTIEPDSRGGWNVLSDPANRGSATFEDVNFGPAVTRRRFSIRPGEMRVVPR